MKLRGAKPGQGAPTGIEECLSCGAHIHAEHRRKWRDVERLE